MASMETNNQADAPAAENATVATSAKSCSFNPCHKLVPEHHLLTDEEAEKVLAELGVEKDKLPKIRLDDPAVKYLSEIHGEVKEGSIIKVVRRSDTAGEFIAYRLVIQG